MHRDRSDLEVRSSCGHEEDKVYLLCSHDTVCLSKITLRTNSLYANVVFSTMTTNRIFLYPLELVDFKLYKFPPVSKSNEIHSNFNSVFPELTIPTDYVKTYKSDRTKCFNIFNISGSDRVVIDGVPLTEIEGVLN